MNVIVTMSERKPCIRTCRSRDDLSVSGKCSLITEQAELGTDKWHCNQCTCADLFDKKSRMRIGCLPFVLFLRQDISSKIVTSGWRPWINLFTPESDQCQNSPATSQEIWHSRSMENLTLHSLLPGERWLYYTNSRYVARTIAFWNLGEYTFWA